MTSAMSLKFKKSWEQVSPKMTDLRLLKKKPLGVVSVSCSHALFLENYSFKLFSKNKCQVDWTSYFYYIFCLYLFILHCGIKKVFDRCNQNLSYSTGKKHVKKSAHTADILAYLSQGLNSKHLIGRILGYFFGFILTMGTMTFFPHNAPSTQSLNKTRPDPG